MISIENYIVTWCLKKCRCIIYLPFFLFRSTVLAVACLTYVVICNGVIEFLCIMWSVNFATMQHRKVLTNIFSHCVQQLSPWRHEYYIGQSSCSFIGDITYVHYHGQLASSVYEASSKLFILCLIENYGIIWKPTIVYCILLCFQALLTMLINKVGDPDYKLASKVSHYLTNLGELLINKVGL